jgi:hypothetical protein
MSIKSKQFDAMAKSVNNVPRASKTDEDTNKSKKRTGGDAMPSAPAGDATNKNGEQKK